MLQRLPLAHYLLAQLSKHDIRRPQHGGAGINTPRCAPVSHAHEIGPTRVRAAREAVAADYLVPAADGLELLTRAEKFTVPMGAAPKGVGENHQRILIIAYEYRVRKG